VLLEPKGLDTTNVRYNYVVVVKQSQSSIGVILSNNRSIVDTRWECYSTAYYLCKISNEMKTKTIYTSQKTDVSR